MGVDKEIVRSILRSVPNPCLPPVRAEQEAKKKGGVWAITIALYVLDI